MATYKDHPNTLVIDFCLDEGFPSRLVVIAEVREKEKEVRISFPLSLFAYYDRIARASGRALGYLVSPIVAGCSHPDDDPINWRENNAKYRTYNTIGNGRCHVVARLHIT